MAGALASDLVELTHIGGSKMTENELKLVESLAELIKAHTNDRQKQLEILELVDVELYEVGDPLST